MDRTNGTKSFRAIIIALAAFGLGSAHATDTQTFTEFLKKNSSGQYCINLERIAKTGTTLDFQLAIGAAVMFESDCAFRALMESNPSLRDSSPSNAGFSSAIGRELSRRRGDKFAIDGGVYGNIRNTMENAIQLGILDSPNSKGDPRGYSLLSSLADNCQVGGDIGEAIHFLIVTYNVDPDRQPSAAKWPINHLENWTPRSVIKQKCPDLEGYLSGGKKPKAKI